MNILTVLWVLWGLPRCLSSKEFAFQWRRHRRHGFHPWVEKIPWRRKGQPTPVFLPGESHGQRSLRGTLHEVRKSRTRLRDRPHAHNTYGTFCLSFNTYFNQSMPFLAFSPPVSSHFGQSEGKSNKYNLSEDSYIEKRQGCLTPLTSPRSGASGRRCWCRGRCPCRGEVWLEVQEIARRFRSAERQVSFYNQIFEILKCKDLFQIKT